MDPKVANTSAAFHPQMLRAGLRSEAKADRKELADLRPTIGGLVARSFQLMGISKQEAAYAMHYEDPGTISRWCSGTERPAFDKLFTLDGFEVAWMLAIAERNQSSVKATTVITIERIA